MLKHLESAKINKKFGYSAAYLFQLVFVLLFHQKNWFRLLESNKAESFPGKDAVYRFLKPYEIRMAAKDRFSLMRVCLLYVRPAWAQSIGCESRMAKAVVAISLRQRCPS